MGFEAGNILGLQALGVVLPTISVPISMGLARPSTGPAADAAASSFIAAPTTNGSASGSISGNGTNGTKNPANVLNRWVDEIGLPLRISRILFRERIATVSRLVTTTKEFLLEMEGLNSERLVEIQKALARHRLTLNTTSQRSVLNLPVSRLTGILPKDVEFLHALEIRFIGDLVQRSIFELNTARLEDKKEKDQRIDRLQTALAEFELQLEMPLIGFRSPEDFDAILEQPIEVLNLGRRLQRCLKDNGIRRVSQLPSIFEELKPGQKKLRGLRREDSQTIREALGVWGIRV